MRYADLLGKRTIFTTRPPDAPAPLVTVVMPTYRRHSEGMLVRCLNSVLGQTLTDFEFIVMDDGSTDGTEKCFTRWPCAIHAWYTSAWSATLACPGF